MLGAILGAVGSLAGGLFGSGGSKSAANAQAQANAQAIAEQQRQFDAIRTLLAPYTQAGNQGLDSLLPLLGVYGPQRQQTAVNAFEQSPMFQAIAQQGENAILQNASATGGLRGGNVQGALAQFRPALLNQQIQQQIGNLSGLTSLGQNAAAGVGNAGMSTGNNISALLQDTGQARAYGALGSGAAWGNALSGLGSQLGGLFGGSGGTLPFNGQVINSNTALAALKGF